MSTAVNDISYIHDTERSTQMNISDTIKDAKRYFRVTDQELGDMIGVSKSLINKIRNRQFQSLTSESLLRISQYFRISIDELLNNKILPPSYHFSDEIHKHYLKAEIDYACFFIKKNDYLYIRPFLHNQSKQGDLIIVEKEGEKIIDTYTGNPNTMKYMPIYHIVGIARLNPNYSNIIADFKVLNVVKNK